MSTKRPLYGVADLEKDDSDDDHRGAAAGDARKRGVRFSDQSADATTTAAASVETGDEGEHVRPEQAAAQVAEKLGLHAAQLPGQLAPLLGAEEVAARKRKKERLQRALLGAAEEDEHGRFHAGEKRTGPLSDPVDGEEVDEDAAAAADEEEAERAERQRLAALAASEHGEFEPFNLNQERREGHFDENMFYVGKRDQGERDPWLDEVDGAKKDQAAVMAAAAAAEEKRRQREEEADDEFVNVPRVTAQLCALLQPGETALTAMQRFKKEGKVKEIENITSLAQSILNAGNMNIYHASREELVRYEYKKEENGEVFGPFTSAQMAAWREQDFFIGDNVVLVHEALTNLPWVRSDTILSWD